MRKSIAGRTPIIPILALVGGLGVVGGLILYLQQVRTQLEQTEQTLAQRTQENEALTAQLQDLQRERNQLEERLKGLRSQLERTTEELTTARQSLSQLQAQAEATTQERAGLQAERARLEQERANTQKHLEDLTKANETLTRTVNGLRSRLQLLDRDYHQLKQKQASLAVNVGNVQPITLPDLTTNSPRAAGSVQGTVVQVNEPYSFVIVDKGSEDGMQVGMGFDILRGSTVVGRATANRLRPRLTACDIVREQTSGSLQVGDRAVQR